MELALNKINHNYIAAMENIFYTARNHVALPEVRKIDVQPAYIYIYIPMKHNSCTKFYVIDAEPIGVTHVEVYVHQEEDDMSSNQLLEGTPLPEKIKTTETNKFNKIFFLRQSANAVIKKEEGELKTLTPRRTKSVRFTETTRPSLIPLEPGMRRSASITFLPQVYNEPTAANNENRFSDIASTSGQSSDRKAFEFETTV